MVEAELAVIAFLLNLREILWREFRYITFVVINAVQQRGERWTQVEAPAASLTDIKNPQSFRFKIRPLPPGSNEVKFWHDKICGRVLFLESCII